MTASLIDGVAVRVGDLVDVAADVPRVDASGQTYTLQELWDGDGVRWPLEDAAIVTVPLQGGLPDGVHEVSIELRLRMSYIPVEHQPSTYKVTKHVTLSPESRRAPVQVRRLPVQLHDRLRHRARPRDRDGGHRRHRRDRHRDPRRGPHPELPEPVAGVGGRLVPAAREVRPRAHQLRLVDRHAPALQRPERPRHDRRGGRRGAPARPPAREAARVPVRPAEDRRGLERPRSAPDLDRGRRAEPPARRGARRRSSAPRSTRPPRSSTRSSTSTSSSSSAPAPSTSAPDRHRHLPGPPDRAQARRAARPAPRVHGRHRASTRPTSPTSPSTSCSSRRSSTTSTRTSKTSRSPGSPCSAP